MPSERVQRTIDQLLDEAERALAAGAWEQVRALCQRLLTIDPDNADALAFLSAAGRGLATLTTAEARKDPRFHEPM